MPKKVLQMPKKANKDTAMFAAPFARHMTKTEKFEQATTMMEWMAETGIYEESIIVTYLIYAHKAMLKGVRKKGGK